MAHLLRVVVIGFIAGVVAKFLMPGKEPGGIIVTIVLGIVGALLAIFLGRMVGLYGPGESAGFISAVLWAIILMVIYRLIKKKKAAA